MGLNAKQKLFVKAYLADRNATKAAIKAGYSKSVKTAQVTGARLLRNAMVRQAIDEGIAAQATRLEITADFVIKRIAEIAHDPLAKRFETLKACELLGKHFKLFTEVHEHGGNLPNVQVNVNLPANGRESKK